MARPDVEVAEVGPGVVPQPGRDVEDVHHVVAEAVADHHEAVVVEGQGAGSEVEVGERDVWTFEPDWGAFGEDFAGGRREDSSKEIKISRRHRHQ